MDVAPTRGTGALLVGATADSVGDDALRTVVPLVAVAALGASGEAVGLINALPFLWFLLGSRLVGGAVDRLGARRATMLGSAIRAGSVLGAILLWGLGTLSVWWLVLIVVVVGFGDALFTTGHSSLVPSVVGPGRTAWCYQRLEAVGSVARVGSPALVSWLLRVTGYPAAFALAAVSYALSLASTASLPSTDTVRDGSRGTIPQEECGPGRWTVRSVVARRGLGGLTVATAILNASAMFSGTALVFFGLEVLGLSPATVALFAAAGAAGGLVGAAVAGPLRRYPTGTAKLATIVGVGLASFIPPSAILLEHNAAAVVLIGEFLVATFATAASVVGSDVPARLVPLDRLGSAFASIRVLTVGVMPVASILSGLVVSALGPTEALVVGACLALLATVPVWPLRGWSPPPGAN